MAEAPEQQPSAEDQQKMQEVSAAGARAKMEGKDPGEAMKDARDRTGFVKLDDESIDQLAAKLNELNLESFRKAGAFDPPPEPVRPPEQPQAPPAPGDQVVPEAHQPAPAKRTPAHRFLGY